jgi:cell wall assembly regulator SMI1
MRTTDSDYNSPYRTGQHVPLGQSNRHAPLTSIATTASESRADLSYTGFEETGRAPLNSSAYPTSPIGYPRPGNQSPSAYSPGNRSVSALSRQTTLNENNFENVTPGEVQMQSFQEGLPPPPPVSHSWRRVDKWAENNYEELFDALGEGATTNDLNELEHQLDCSLPLEVRESLQIHDGQETGGRPTGIIFSSMLLDCEEIVHEWNNWRVVNEEYLTQPVTFKPATPMKALGGSSSSSSRTPAQQAPANPLWRQELMARQDSQPPNAIQKVYAHPAWIPLVRDWGGNNLAVDLAPGPAGKWGQVILFGRDYDCKYVVARSWSAFMAMVADDLNSGKWFVDEDTNELKLREFKSQNVEPGYLDILRWRSDQKYGRRNARRRSTQANGNSPTGSPYASPSAQVGTEPRGRSMQRFSGASPVASPNRPSYGVSSPLARVNEETAAPIKVHTGNLPNGKLVEVPTPSSTTGTTSVNGKLVGVTPASTPRASDEEKRSKTLEALLAPAPAIEGKGKENVKISEVKTADIALMNGSAHKQATVEDDDKEMKTIEI